MINLEILPEPVSGRGAMRSMVEGRRAAAGMRSGFQRLWRGPSTTGLRPAVPLPQASWGRI